MSPEAIAAITSGTLIVVIVFALIGRRMPKRLKADTFMTRWRQLQDHCKDRATWPLALSEADQLLDRALKKRKFKGKSMGERMVSAQKVFSNNDAVWFAHNFYKKAAANADAKLKETDMKAALVGFRQALRDLGALKTDTGKDQSSDKEG